MGTDMKAANHSLGGAPDGRARVTGTMIDDALRFMGVRGENLDDRLVGQVQRTFRELEGLIRPRIAWGRFPVSVSRDGVRVAGAGIASADLARLLARSQECYLLAVTLGPDVDRHISLAQQRDMLEGVTLDACASVRADVLCDEAEGEIAAALGEGEFLTRRFSPGYGDAPLSASADIIQLLDATRRIGLSMTRSHMLTPIKSITAIAGITRERGRERTGPRDCGGCAARMRCPYARTADN